jgi:uncharacterized membrane protein
MDRSVHNRINPLPLVIAGALIAALFIVSVVVYGELPARIPQHFGIDGTPDRWVDRSIVSWLLLPIISLMLSGFVVLIASFLPRDLKLLNVPNKERLLALPKHRQAVVATMVRNTMHWIVVIVLLLFSGIQTEVFLSARTGESTGLGWLTGACIAGVLVMAYSLNVRLQRMVAEEGA